MTDKLHEKLEEDYGVSPVIGVVLLVAIVVILAAVIGALLLGFGDLLEGDAQDAGFELDESAGEITTLTGEGDEDYEVLVDGESEGVISGEAGDSISIDDAESGDQVTIVNPETDQVVQEWTLEEGTQLDGEGGEGENYEDIEGIVVDNNLEENKPEENLFKDIPEALDEVEDGDNVTVLSGEYSGFTLDNNNVKLEAEDDAIITDTFNKSYEGLEVPFYTSIQGDNNIIEEIGYKTPSSASEGIISVEGNDNELKSLYSDGELPDLPSLFLQISGDDNLVSDLQGDFGGVSINGKSNQFTNSNIQNSVYGVSTNRDTGNNFISNVVIGGQTTQEGQATSGLNLRNEDDLATDVEVYGHDHGVRIGGGELRDSKIYNNEGDGLDISSDGEDIFVSGVESFDNDNFDVEFEAGRDEETREIRVDSTTNNNCFDMKIEDRYITQGNFDIKLDGERCPDGNYIVDKNLTDGTDTIPGGASEEDNILYYEEVDQALSQASSIEEHLGSEFESLEIQGYDDFVYKGSGIEDGFPITDNANDGEIIGLDNPSLNVESISEVENLKLEGLEIIEVDIDVVGADPDPEFSISDSNNIRFEDVEINDKNNLGVFDSENIEIEDVSVSEIFVNDGSSDVLIEAETENNTCEDVTVQGNPENVNIIVNNEACTGDFEEFEVEGEVEGERHLDKLTTESFNINTEKELSDISWSGTNEPVSVSEDSKEATFEYQESNTEEPFEITVTATDNNGETLVNNKEFDITNNLRVDMDSEFDGERNLVNIDQETFYLDVIGEDIQDLDDVSWSWSLDSDSWDVSRDMDSVSEDSSEAVLSYDDTINYGDTVNVEATATKDTQQDEAEIEFDVTKEKELGPENINVDLNENRIAPNSNSELYVDLVNLQDLEEGDYDVRVNAGIEVEGESDYINVTVSGGEIGFVDTISGEDLEDLRLNADMPDEGSYEFTVSEGGEERTETVEVDYPLLTGIDPVPEPDTGQTDLEIAHPENELTFDFSSQTNDLDVPARVDFDLDIIGESIGFSVETLVDSGDSIDKSETIQLPSEVGSYSVMFDDGENEEIEETPVFYISDFPDLTDSDDSPVDPDSDDFVAGEDYSFEVDAYTPKDEDVEYSVSIGDSDSSSVVSGSDEFSSTVVEFNVPEETGQYTLEVRENGELLVLEPDQPAQIPVDVVDE